MIENSVATVNATDSNTTEIVLFNNPDFGQVRTMMIGGEPWFVGKDVAEILRYANQNRDIIRHVDEEDRIMINHENQLNTKMVSSLGQRGGWLINESGLYSLILSSKLPTAKKFKRWVTSEVLPSIRKTGGYGVASNNAKLLAEIAGLKQEVTEIKSLVTPTQPNYFLWKKNIANPLVNSVSNILGISVADTYKAIYDDMVMRGFNQPYAMNRFCNKYKVDSVSTIDAVADVDDYVRMFMESVSRFLELNAVATPNAANFNANVNNPKSNTLNIDSSTILVETIIQPLVELYHDTSINNAYTYKRVYKVMRSDRSWKALMTRRHCRSKKNLVTKFADIRRDFAKAVTQLMETGIVEVGGEV